MPFQHDQSCMSRYVFNETQLQNMKDGKKLTFLPDNAITKGSQKKTTIHTEIIKGHWVDEAHDSRLNCLKKRFKHLFSRSITENKQTAHALYNQYLNKIIELNPEIDKEKIIYKLSVIFSLMGLNPLIQKNKTSTSDHIHLATIQKLDQLLTYSSSRLAYEFFAKNKKLPPGFLKTLLIPEWTEQTKQAQHANPEAFIQKHLHDLYIHSDSQVTFETIIEIKHKIKSLKMNQHAAHHPSKMTHDTVKKQADLSICALPKPTQYQCDHEDTWLIHQLVDNKSKIFIHLDRLSYKIQNFVKHEKRIIIINAFNIILESLIMGVLTGGIGTAITAVSSTSSVLGMVIVKLMISLALHQKAIYQLKKHKKNNKQIEKNNRLQLFFKYASKALAKQGIESTLIAHQQFAGKMSHLDKTKTTSQNNAATYIQYCKELRSAYNRYHQLSHILGNLPHSTHDDDIKTQPNPLSDQAKQHEFSAYKSLDHVLLSSVEEISRLNYEFDTEFHALWEPFSKMPTEQVWSIFNKEANARNLKKNNFSLNYNCSKWIQKITQHVDLKYSSKETESVSQKMNVAFFKKNHKPIIPLTRSHRTIHKVSNTMRSMVSIGTKITTNIVSIFFSTKVYQIIFNAKYALQPISLLPDLLDSVISPIISFINKKKNRTQLNKTQINNTNKKILDQKFTKNDIYLFKKESIPNIKKLIDILKKLEEHHLYIKNTLLKKTQSQDMTLEKKQKLFAHALLKQKMLSTAFNQLLSKTVGSFHESITIKSSKNLVLLEKLLKENHVPQTTTA
ncbi:MAG: hypothetical protein HAW62_05535 [Endozoicomonadaceae bacterium]|nr:hypothetical protein [Endozoicomonadaceae bacterium]